MFNRQTISPFLLTVWVVCLTTAALAQAPPPEPTYSANPIDDCPSPEQLQQAFRALEEIPIGMQLEGKEVPPDCSGNVFQGTRRGIAFTEEIVEFNWAPADFFHKPLYFDDTPLERYGQSVCPHLQPIISGGRFVAALPIVPYKMGYDHPFDCVTNLGHYRPGICAPCVMQVPPPLSMESALLQAATTVGLVLLLP